jgi:hypothetical protein
VPTEGCNHVKVEILYGGLMTGTVSQWTRLAGLIQTDVAEVIKMHQSRIRKKKFFPMSDWQKRATIDSRPPPPSS